MEQPTKMLSFSILVMMTCVLATISQGKQGGRYRDIPFPRNPYNTSYLLMDCVQAEKTFLCDPKTVADLFCQSYTHYSGAESFQVRRFQSSKSMALNSTVFCDPTESGQDNISSSGCTAFYHILCQYKQQPALIPTTKPAHL